MFIIHVWCPCGRGHVQNICIVITNVLHCCRHPCRHDDRFESMIITAVDYFITRCSFQHESSIALDASEASCSDEMQVRPFDFALGNNRQIHLLGLLSWRMKLLMNVIDGNQEAIGNALSVFGLEARIALDLYSHLQHSDKLRQRYKGCRIDERGAFDCEGTPCSCRHASAHPIGCISAIVHPCACP